MGGACIITWERGGAFRDMTGKSQGKRQLGRPVHKWEDNIRMYL
jgi:hypothetical protein